MQSRHRTDVRPHFYSQRLHNVRLPGRNIEFRENVDAEQVSAASKVHGQVLIAADFEAPAVKCRPCLGSNQSETRSGRVVPFNALLIPQLQAEAGITAGFCNSLVQGKELLSAHENLFEAE